MGTIIEGAKKVGSSTQSASAGKAMSVGQGEAAAGGVSQSAAAKAAKKSSTVAERTGLKSSASVAQVEASKGGDAANKASEGSSAANKASSAEASSVGRVGESSAPAKEGREEVQRKDLAKQEIHEDPDGHADSNSGNAEREGRGNEAVKAEDGGNRAENPRDKLDGEHQEEGGKKLKKPKDEEPRMERRSSTKLKGKDD